MSMLRTGAPDFSLLEPATGITRSLSDFADSDAFLVMVLSNHCPFVKHIAGGLAEFAREYEQRGVGIVAINANDVMTYPEDVKAYQAACTPDFFLFDADRKLVYRGQFDASRPSLPISVTGKDLRDACEAVLAGRCPDEEQVPSVGCNIKWKPGNEPRWFRQ